MARHFLLRAEETTQLKEKEEAACAAGKEMPPTPRPMRSPRLQERWARAAAGRRRGAR